MPTRQPYWIVGAGIAGVVTVGVAALSNFAHAQSISELGTIRVFTAGPQSGTPPNLDFVGAEAMKLPIASRYSTENGQLDLIRSLATAEHLSLQAQAGSSGNGVTIPLNVGVPSSQPVATIVPTNPEEAGTAGLPFSTARADLDPQPTNEQWPYRAAGKLFFLIDGKTYVCSASLIKKGVVVTAAHCVSEYGQKKYFSNWQFIPGYRNGAAPFGKWTVNQALVLDSYYSGTDQCFQKGVVCQDDVAVLVLNPQRDANNNTVYVGANTGWYGFGWNPDAFTPQGTTHITQIGYPNCLDNGAYMERNDTQGFTSATYTKNTLAGSLMCGGSSGGPWILNFGIRPSLVGTSPGSGSEANLVIGVTSWGSTNNAVKQMGASPFLSSNIGQLITTVCNAHPDACN